MAGRKIGDAGLWMKGMSNVSYHPDIGHMPLWYNRAVYSGDWRMREVMLEQADLAGAFPLQLREGDPVKKADRAQTVPAVGMPVSVYARPTSGCWTRATRRALPTRSWCTARKARPVISTCLAMAIHPGIAHQPDPFFVPYLLTGDPFYLHGLQLGPDTIFCSWTTPAIASGLMP